MHDDGKGTRPALSGVRNLTPAELAGAMNEKELLQLKEALSQQEKEMNKAKAAAVAKVGEFMVCLSACAWAATYVHAYKMLLCFVYVKTIHACMYATRCTCAEYVMLRAHNITHTHTHTYACMQPDSHTSSCTGKALESMHAIRVQALMYQYIHRKGATQLHALDDVIMLTWMT